MELFAGELLVVLLGRDLELAAFRTPQPGRDDAELTRLIGIPQARSSKFPTPGAPV